MKLSWQLMTVRKPRISIKIYAKRASIEGTISQGVRKIGLRQARYIGLSSTRLQHIATAAAINLFRVFD